MLEVSKGSSHDGPLWLDLRHARSPRSFLVASLSPSRSLFLCKHAWNDLTLPPFASVYYAASRHQSAGVMIHVIHDDSWLRPKSLCLLVVCLGGLQIWDMTLHKWFVCLMDCLAVLEMWKLTRVREGRTTIWGVVYLPGAGLLHLGWGKLPKVLLQGGHEACGRWRWQRLGICGQKIPRSVNDLQAKGMTSQ